MTRPVIRPVIRPVTRPVDGRLPHGARIGHRGEMQETEEERLAREAREEQVRADAARARARAAERRETMQFVRELDMSEEIDD